MPSGLPPLSRKNLKDDIIDIELFKKEMRSRLFEQKGALINKAGFLNKAVDLPIYSINKKVAKLLLLAAHHNTIEDLMNPGLLVKGKEALNSCLTSEMYSDDTVNTPFLTQHHRRIIKPPACTQQVSYH